MDSMTLGSTIIMVKAHIIGVVHIGDGIILGDMAIMLDGTTHGLILGMTHGIMVMLDGMVALGMEDGVVTIPGIGVVLPMSLYVL